MEPNIDQTVEIKARCPDPEKTAAIIREAGARLTSSELQEDTFYRVQQGRLKLRRSKTDRYLIGYRRPDMSGPKHCLVNLYAYRDADRLDKVLTEALGVRVSVKKMREVYRLDNIKFHIDRVEGLGSFVEIEVLGLRGNDSVEELRETCEKYLSLLEIQPEDLVEAAYADLLEEASPSC
jgi:adenylate cyclase, class 2